MSRLTLRPQFPKSCREFATTSIPSHIIVLISTSSYSSVTVGKKKTSLPRGLSIAREKRTRSETSSESSYGFVGGIYGWSVLLRRWLRLERMKKGGNTEPSCSCERLDAFGYQFSGFLSSKSFRASTDTIYARR